MRVDVVVSPFSSSLDLSDNLLTGTVPDGVAVVSTLSIDYNCYVNTITPHHNPLCSTNSEEWNALVDLYNAAGGASWTDQGTNHWSTVISPDNDPCFSQWSGVTCSIDEPSHIVYVRVCWQVFWPPGVKSVYAGV